MRGELPECSTFACRTWAVSRSREKLAAAELEVPVIFMTGYADIHMSVRAS